MYNKALNNIVCSGKPVASSCRGMEPGGGGGGGEGEGVQLPLYGLLGMCHFFGGPIVDRDIVIFGVDFLSGLRYFARFF